MGKVAEPLLAGKVAFDLERFELADGERFALRGRWFGVRGRRFIRPTLTLFSDGGETRLLADLEHKPWPAEEGELWQAAFCAADRWDEASGAELNVAPDLTIELPLPDAGGHKRSAARPQGRRPRTPDRPQAVPRRPRERPDHERALSAARAELTDARRERDDAREQLERARGERDVAVSQRDEARRQRQAAHGTLEDLATARDSVTQAYERAVAERDAIAAERDAAVAERDSAVTERNRAVAARDAALAERDAAVSERDAAVTDRDAAISAHAEMAAAREELAAANKRARLEHDQLAASRGATMVMRNAVVDSSQRESRWLALAIAGVCVLIVVLVAALLFGLR